MFEVGLEWGRKRIHPLRGRDEIFERARRLDVIDTERDDVDALVDRPLDFAFEVKTRIMMRLDSIALMIDSPQSAPGTTSRGATQHWIESASSRATIASATALSLTE
jgi:hypothetical protein